MLTATSNVLGIPRQLSQVGWKGATNLATTTLALAFCALVVRAYLRRGPARATDRGRLVWVAAPLATCLPLGLAAVRPVPGGSVRTLLALVLTLSGLAVSVSAVRALATNLSVVPQAREVVAHGPYRLVRHPLYLGELVGLAGVALHVGRWPLALVVALELLLQVYRATREEQLLSHALPGYATYARGTRRLVPGIW